MDRRDYNGVVTSAKTSVKYIFKFYIEEESLSCILRCHMSSTVSRAHEYWVLGPVPRCPHRSEGKKVG